MASDYIQRSIASAVRHELPALEAYSGAVYARILDLQGEWSKAEDLAIDLLNRMALSQMVALPIVGVLAARKGRERARSILSEAWEMAVLAGENQRLAPAAAAFAEYAWIADDREVPFSEFRRIMHEELEKGFSYTPGSIAFWLWKLDELGEVPDDIAEPYRAVMLGSPMEAASFWQTRGVPYEQALATMHGDHAAQLEALEMLEGLGASPVAARLRSSLRDAGVSVPRGKGQRTREHAAGLTARQAEVLDLLGEGLSNTGIADRLFLSPRTVENHVSAVLSKLDVTTRDMAVERARTEGLLAT